MERFWDYRRDLPRVIWSLIWYKSSAEGNLKVFLNLAALRKIPWFHLISWSGNFAERHSFRIDRNYAETRRFRKISTLGNQVKLQYFPQCCPLLHNRKNTRATSNLSKDDDEEICYRKDEIENFDLFQDFVDDE